jgi:hypothetical protein
MMASPSFFDLVVELQEIHKAKDNSLEHSYNTVSNSTLEGTQAPTTLKKPNYLQGT